MIDTKIYVWIDKIDRWVDRKYLTTYLPDMRSKMTWKKKSNNGNLDIYMYIYILDE